MREVNFRDGREKFGTAVFAAMFWSEGLKLRLFVGDVLESFSFSESESTSIMSVSGSSEYGIERTERGLFPKAFLRGLIEGGARCTGVGDREGLFSLLALTGSSFSSSLISIWSSSRMGCGWGMSRGG